MTSVIPNTAAWPSAVLPGAPPESGAEMASMSAPASISTLATSASPELAAVISGVSLSPGCPLTWAPAVTARSSAGAMSTGSKRAGREPGSGSAVAAGR